MPSEPAKVNNKGDEKKIEAPGKISPMVLSDEELVVRAQKDDTWATEELIHRYQKKAYAIAHHICFGDKEQAQDVTQEAFLKVFKNLKKFRGKSTFYTWFYRIVVNTCIDGMRRKQRREKIFSLWRRRENRDAPLKKGIEGELEMEATVNPLQVLSGKELATKAQEVLQSLSEKQRIVFQLKVIQEMSITEIAKVMKMAEGTVKSHLFRATHVLREALEEWVSP
ncbi:MAG: sigma-70 family RNA polymerase sigma factor [Desulfobacteraceae bacterium]